MKYLIAALSALAISILYGIFVGGMLLLSILSIVFIICVFILSVMSKKEKMSLYDLCIKYLIIIVVSVIFTLGSDLIYYCINELHGTVTGEYEATVTMVSYHHSETTASFIAPDGTEKSVDFVEVRPPIMTDEDEEMMLKEGDIIRVQEKIGLFGYPYIEMADADHTTLWISILILVIVIITIEVSVLCLRNTSIFKKEKRKKIIENETLNVIDYWRKY